MSIDRCCACASLIDTDFDLDCYPTPGYVAICERCRETEEKEPD